MFVPSAAFILGVAFVDCNQAPLAIVLLTLGSGLTGFTRGGVYSNHVDMSTRCVQLIVIYDIILIIFTFEVFIEINIYAIVSIANSLTRLI